MSKVFGNPKSISGRGGSYRSSLVPIDLLQNLKQRNPVPVTIGGTNGVTFTLNHSVTNRGTYWIGNDYATVDRTVAYTWVAGSNNILNATTGAATTLTNSTTGVWYMYLSMSSTGALTLIPSKGAPSYVEGPYGAGTYVHPGTARAADYTYVGFMINTTANLVFTEPVKVGYVYHLPAVVSVNNTVTAAAVLDFSATLPKHGVEVSGYAGITGAVGTTLELSATTGVAGQKITAQTTKALTAPFGPIVVDSAGKIAGTSSTTVAHPVSVSQIRDVV